MYGNVRIKMTYVFYVKYIVYGRVFKFICVNVCIKIASTFYVIYDVYRGVVYTNRKFCDIHKTRNYI